MNVRVFKPTYTKPLPENTDTEMIRLTKSKNRIRVKTKDWYVGFIYKGKSVKVRAFWDEDKTKELALQLERLLSAGWEGLSFFELSYWATLNSDVMQRLESKGVIKLSDIFYRIEGMKEYPLSFLSESHIYFLLLGEEVVYIGQSLRVGRRLTCHFTDDGKEFDRVFVKTLYSVTPMEANKIEKFYINKYKPRYNINCQGKRTGA